MRLTLSFIGLALVAASVLSAGGVTTFSSGFVVPESISAAPASFGLAAGSLVVVDYGDGAVKAVRSTGGSATLLKEFFSTFPTPTQLNGGVFAPNGSFIVDGYNNIGGVPLGVVYSLSSAAGTPATLVSAADTAFLGSAIAPTGFGSVAGDTLLVAAESQNAILALSPTGTLSRFASLSAMHEHLFATVPLTAGQTGLRQLAFAPSGFATASANYSGDLFVSVSGSAAGGGTFGSVDVLNSSGSLVAVLAQGAVGAPFDPRGLYFEGSNQLLIADADPSILSATPASFAPVPEPSVFGAMGLGLGVMVLLRRRSRG